MVKICLIFNDYRAQLGPFYFCMIVEYYPKKKMMMDIHNKLICKYFDDPIIKIDLPLKINVF